MTREIRNDSIEGWFHLTNRGARRYDTFVSEDDRRVFIRALHTHSTNYAIRVAAVCLMANHYHLVAFCPEGNLSSFMQRVGADYTRHFNRVHQFDGPLNRHRFHSELLDSDDYLLTTLRYVHRNPLEVELDIRTHPWSSYPCILDGPRPRLRGIEIDNTIGLELAGGRDRYIRFVETDLPTDKAPLANGTNHYQAPDGRTAPTLDQIDRSVDCASFEVTRQRNLRPAQRSRKREIAIVIAVDRGAHSVVELATHHGYSSKSSVYSALRRARQRTDTDASSFEILQRALASLSKHGSRHRIHIDDHQFE